MSRLNWLYRVFDENLDGDFIVWREQKYSYGWLRDHIAAWQARLAASTITRGTVVAVEGDYSPEVVAILLALIDAGCIVVPLAASSAPQREEFKSIAEVQAGICFSEGDSFTIAQYPRAVGNPVTQKLIALGDPGLVLFSSGSTGKSKAALHNFALLLEKFQVRRNSMVTLTMLLLDHIGGLNTLFYVLSNAGTVVAVDNRDPDAVCSAIARHRVELLPTSPTFLNLLLISEAWKLNDLSSLRRVTYGTEVMPSRTLQRLHEIVPKVELLQTYGLSELGILRSKSRSSDSLWVRVGGEGVETKVQQGTLWIRTRSAMLGYLNAPSPFDEEGWFNTGDTVEVDGEYLRILGRKSEVINVGGEKVYPVEVENVLLDMPNVKDVTVSAMSNPITGQVVMARFNLFEPKNSRPFAGVCASFVRLAWQPTRSLPRWKSQTKRNTASVSKRCARPISLGWKVNLARARNDLQDPRHIGPLVPADVTFCPARSAKLQPAGSSRPDDPARQHYSGGSFGVLLRGAGVRVRAILQVLLCCLRPEPAYRRVLTLDTGPR
jgi:long-chain acyl-CoA synthetase